MAVCTIDKDTFTGAEFIAAMGGVLTSVGAFDAAAIDNDIALNEDFSQPGIASTLLNCWIRNCQVPLDMSVELCATLKQGYKFMVLYMYQELYITTQKSCGCDCTEHDYAFQGRLKESACRYFCQISECIKKYFVSWTKASCVDSVPPKYDFSQSGISRVTDNCPNYFDTPFGCDSCGC